MMDYLKHNKLTFIIYSCYLRLLTRNVKSFVFLCTTGRSGTNTLTNLFLKVPHFASVHEPYPTMFTNGSDLPKNVTKNLSLDKRKYLNILKTAKGKELYLETNHLFIKTFYHVVLKYLPDRKIKLIHLERDPLKVATSFYAINSIPGKPPTGDRFLLDPFAENNLIKVNHLFSDPQYSHDFYKCLWYWYETELRIKKFKLETPNISWMHIKTDDLNDENKILSICEFLEQDADVIKGYLDYGRKDNLKTFEKKSFDDIDFDMMHKEFKSLLCDKGYL